MTTTPTSPRDRFLRMMSIVLLVAGLAWLVVALINVRQGGSFDWTGVAVFLILLAAFFVARGKSGRSSR